MQRRQPDRPQRQCARCYRAPAKLCAAAVQLQVAVLRLVLRREQQDRGQRAAHVRVRRAHRRIFHLLSFVISDWELTSCNHTQSEEVLPQRRYQLRHQLHQPPGSESRCSLPRDQRVFSVQYGRRRREAVGARLLGIGRCMQRGADAQAAPGRSGEAPVLRLGRSAGRPGLQRAGGGAAGRQVLPDRHDLLVGDLRRALDELLGLRGESEPGKREGCSCSK